MTLHIFNPDHDLALASNLSNFTSPHAGRQLRHDLNWIPALWAEDGSYVLTDDVERAERAVSRRKTHHCNFVTPRQLHKADISHIEPWGWNAALCAELVRWGVSSDLLPSSNELQNVRELSHRRTAALILPMLQTEGTTGLAYECSTKGEILQLLSSHKAIVLKAPWSSSGRGLRFLSLASNPTEHHEGWIRNILSRQGSVMVEPHYRNVKDFGMEFSSDGKGKIDFLGLSLFHTANGAYTGNMLATENAKTRYLTERYLKEELLLTVKEKICDVMGPVMKDKYSGPFGVDMMVVRTTDDSSNDTLLLHPCVEVNLRRTMGHASLEAEKLYNRDYDDDMQHVMRIIYQNNKYKLLIRRL